MSVIITNDCCDCATPGYPCLGSACNLRHSPHYFCDECDDEVESGELFWYEGRQLCGNCVFEELEVVKGYE